ncbi:DUF3467 domain-containing protein [Elizabethkingia argentiflava]|uniref:DUF3467 domain-containing protein n=1 Tax=Elizabethkingia argenteiflava TaxID=2681556 RepID=A0A845PVL5_9FLAO|nr:DUF3467 domain-containing protein [Elizabethkingia argenteiflava]NAW52262.1 DUF3467 domain-containing protein [Elizabethkingia argenteiflava]
MDNQNQDGNINIELNETVAAGVYANLGLVNHSPSEFILDFIQLMPGVQQAKVRSRVILAPLHAKRILNALQQNIVSYEQQFGEIKEVEPFVLGQNTPQA